MPDQELELVARGLAHDLNNVLSEILGHASLLETGTLEKAEVQESAEAIHRAAKRASEIASRLANLSLVDGRPKVPTDVNALAREVAALLRATLPEGIRLAEDLRAKHPLVEADPGALHEVLLNLALNARDAMPDGGELSLVTCDDGDGVVEVSVRDTGDGIEPATLERVFEPFYTTRSECGNSGLGLAIVRRIVQSHGGRIQLDSRPGQGTMARVLLPRGSVHLGAALHVDATVRGSKV